MRWLEAAGSVQFGGQRGHVAFGALQLGLGRGGDDAGADGGHDVLAHPLSVLQAALVHGGVGRRALEGGRDCALEALERSVAQQVALHACQDAALGGLARYAQSAAAGGVAAILLDAAAVAVAVDDDHRAAAGRAAQQAAEQVARLSAGPPCVGLAEVGAALAAEARLHGLPRLRVHDGQLGLVGGDPLALGALLADPPAGVRMLDPAAAVPDLPPGVDRVGEDADAAAGVAVDGGHAPGAAACRRDAIGIEPCRDLARAEAFEVLAVDAAHHVGLLLVDRTATRADHAVPVGQPTGAGAIEGTAGEAAVGLVSQVVQVQLRHQAAQAHVDLVALALRVDAIAYADQAHAGERQPLDHLADLVLVAPQARQVVDQQHVVAVDVGQQPAVAVAVEPGAADRGVGVLHRRRHVVARRPRAAVAQLVVEAGLALGIGAVAGVGGNAHPADPRRPGP
ncbi:hypothetical protein [Xanthomonas sp. XNM01]|uniref:hypothetical protein n=1 Tax=Xanthomonas sp. XNM01 TaxID=2769289 RepID=UPI002103248A|nr:hypothetical protein [Xanthomonas sp. XNM01]